MMLPSEILYVRVYIALLDKTSYSPYGKFARVMLFITGYGIAWTLFGAFAYVIDTAMREVVINLGAKPIVEPLLASITFLLAGIYQISPLKRSCLLHCRSPISYFARTWHQKLNGSVYMGLKHGFICVGCCWALMAIMFAVGALNLVWMGILTLFMFAEKVFPYGDKLGVPITIFLWVMSLWFAFSPDSAPFYSNFQSHTEHINHSLPGIQNLH